MKKILLGVFTFIFIITLVGCTTSKIRKDTNEVQSNEQPIILYEDYRNIVNTLSEDLKIDNYTVKDHTEVLSLVMIDKELSFNKRQFITLDGTDKSSQTQDRIILEDEKKKSIALIDLIYLDHYIGNDLLGVDMSRPLDVKNKELLEQCDYNMISFNNIIIKITLLAEQVDYDDTYLITKDVVDFLTQYKTK